MLRYLTCPYCEANIDIFTPNHKSHYISYEPYSYTKSIPTETEDFSPSCVKVEFYKCPYCDEYIIFATGKGVAVKNLVVPIKPFSVHKEFSDKIPKSIINDYYEACDIVYLSPKASATLSRRCLQGIIRDVWKTKENSLWKEILALQDKIKPELWNSINALRQIGNIGAHMECDVNTIIDIEPNEAKLLIKLLELLFNEWYVDEPEKNMLLSTINNINQEKQSQRNHKE